MPRPLSPRENSVCEMAARGLVNKQIADVLGIRVCTVDSYWKRIFSKFNVNGRTHAVALFVCAGERLRLARTARPGPCPQPHALASRRAG